MFAVVCEQSDVEKLEGLPVAEFMDRDKVTKSKSQTGFIKFVLQPLFESLGRLYPSVVVSFKFVLQPLFESLGRLYPPIVISIKFVLQPLFK